MPTARHPAKTQVWTIQSIYVRTRDGPDRLAQAYRALLDMTPPEALPPGAVHLTDPVTKGGFPCVPPSMPASQPSARNVSRPLTVNLTPSGPGPGTPDTN